MKRIEKLKEHLTKLKETKTEIEITDKKLKTLGQEWNARSDAFNEWLKSELKITGQETEYLIPVILLKWTEKNAN